MLQKEGYPLEWLQELKDKNNIIDVISRYVPLKQSGGNFWGCCPFHHEKTPSFSVKDSGQFYHCFGCGESGDVITFIQKIEGLTFPEAVQFLADRAGMQVPSFVKTDRSGDMKKKRDRLLEIATLAAKFYHESLMGDAGQAARDYLESRGIGKNLMVRFGLGYSPDYNAVINMLKQKGYSEEEIVESGVGWLSEKATSKRPFDTLQQRMIVPIINATGNVVAFSGRAITKDYKGGKYINSKNTAIFEKGKTVYAANFVKKEKQKAPVPKVIVVEGYMDVISLAKYGINNAVAGMGTAFTPMQARIIHGLADSVYVCYDGDSAGEDASWRNLSVLSNEGLNVYVVSIPDEGMDPDDYVKKYGRAGFEKLLTVALPCVEYALECIAKKYDMNTMTGRAKYVAEALEYVKSVQNNAGREVYLEIIHDKSRVPTDVLRQGFDNDISGIINSTAPVPEVTRTTSDAETEAARFVLNTIASHPEFASPSDIFDVDVFSEDVHKAVYNYLKETVEGGGKPAIHMLYSLSLGEEVAHIVNTVKDFSDETTYVRFYRDSLKLLNGNYLKYIIKVTSQKFDRAADTDEKKALWAQLAKYQAVQKDLK